MIENITSTKLVEWNKLGLRPDDNRELIELSKSISTVVINGKLEYSTHPISDFIQKRPPPEPQPEFIHNPIDLIKEAKHILTYNKTLDDILKNFAGKNVLEVENKIKNDIVRKNNVKLTLIEHLYNSRYNPKLIHVTSILYSALMDYKESVDYYSEKEVMKTLMNEFINKFKEFKYDKTDDNKLQAGYYRILSLYSEYAEKFYSDVENMLNYIDSKLDKMPEYIPLEYLVSIELKIKQSKLSEIEKEILNEIDKDYNKHLLLKIILGKMNEIINRMQAEIRKDMIVDYKIDLRQLKFDIAQEYAIPELEIMNDRLYVYNNEESESNTIAYSTKSYTLYYMKYTNIHKNQLLKQFPKLKSERVDLGKNGRHTVYSVQST